MKLKSFALLLLAATQVAKPQTVPIPTVVIIDDNTGQEIRELHGIEPLARQDLEPLLGRGEFRIHHLWVDGNSSGNPVASLKLTVPPVALPSLPARGGRLAEMARDFAEYKQQMVQARQAAGETTRMNHRAIEEFFDRVSANQARCDGEFQERIAKRGGQDYARSDIVGAVGVAAMLLEGCEPGYLVLNTDLDHRPARPDASPPKLRLHPQTVVVLVNQSLLPQRSPLIAGLPNEILEAATLAEAITTISTRTSHQNSEK